MKKDDLKNAPKLFCESVNVGFTPEYFVTAFTSGNQANIYSFSPQHMKRLSQYLTHQISEYEQKHGEIDAKWNPNVVSPVQQVTPPREGS